MVICWKWKLNIHENYTTITTIRHFYVKRLKLTEWKSWFQTYMICNSHERFKAGTKSWIGVERDS